jgi:hypothetical protein
MNVGLKLPRSGTSDRTSGVWPSFVPVITTPISMIRAKTWARGKNSSVHAPGEQNVEHPHGVSQLGQEVPWVSSQPLGRPAVPEV